MCSALAKGRLIITLDESSDEESVQRLSDDARSSSPLPSRLIPEIKAESLTNKLAAIDLSAIFDSSDDEPDLKLSLAPSIEPVTNVTTGCLEVIVCI